MNATPQLHDNAMPAGSDKFYSARIVERRDISDDLWVIRVDPGGEFHYEPGQYATLGVVTPERHYERAYSIVSVPHEELLEFFVELVPHGDVTPRLYADRVGDKFTLRKVAKGRFTLDTNSNRTNHLLVATVTGVAPSSALHGFFNSGGKRGSSRVNTSYS